MKNQEPLIKAHGGYQGLLVFPMLSWWVTYKGKLHPTKTKRPCQPSVP